MDNINLNSSVSSESTGALEFKGSSEKFTEVYIIDYKIHDEDIESGYPLSGPRGSYLCSLLGAMSLLDRTRFASWQGQGADVVKQDILRSNPSVIIGLGSELMNLFITTNRKVTDMSGTVSDITIDGHPFKYLVLPSPSYVLRKVDNPEVALRFSQDLYKAFQIVTKEYVNVLESKEVLSAHSFEEFKEIYESHFVNDSRIAYDIETNARPIYAEDSKIVGFSIGNKKSGVYVSLSALDFEMDPEDHDMIVDYLINCIFKEKDKLIIHNTMYERPYTLHCYKYEIGFDKADDTLVMSRLLKGSKEGAGLKYQAQKNLGYPDWETDLSTYISGFRGAVDRIVFGPKKYANLWGEIRDYTHNIFDVYHTKAYYDLSDGDREELMSIIDKLKSPMVDLYSDDEIENIGKLIVDKLIIVEGQGGILDSTIPYNWIPDRVLSKYGAIDSISTYDLCEYYEKVMDTDSTDKVDLHKGYRNWLEHMYVAYIMERNGLYFDDDVAERDKRFLTDQATRCLKSMIVSPLFEPFILETCEWKYKPIILSDYLPDIATSQGFSVEYDRNTEKYIVKKDGKRVAKGRIDEIQVGASPEYMSLIKMMFKEEVEKAGSYEDLKCIYNPSSSTQSNIPRQILINDTLQMGGRVTKLHTLAASPEFEKIIDQLPVVDQKFLKVACLLKDTDKLKELYGKEWATKRKELFEGFCVMHRSLMSRVVTEEIKSILNDRCPVVIESFDDGGIIEIYNNLLVTGVDQDDESTWTPQFQWMINFRLYKKSQKIISSYIEGSVGRDSVVVVNKEDLSSGSHDVSRKRRYTPNISSEETYLMAAKWSPNTAETGRWRSAIHTIPWGSQVKKYYTSRFLGGTTLAPDYSQMEVRTLAAISKDENMLELFRSGKDFHTETAKKIYRKDEVTAAERRFSKTACWFGDTKIKLLDGSSMTIEEMYRSGKKDWDVYSFDLNEEHFRPGKTYDVQLSKYVDQYAEVVLDNGATLRCTVDHPFLTRGGQYVKAEDLYEGLKLESLFTRYSPRGTMPGYEQYFDTRYRFVCGTRNSKIYQTRCGRWIMTHRTVYGERHRGCQVDHINGLKYDNRPENLQELGFVENRSKTRIRLELNDKFNSLPSIIKRMELMKSQGESLDEYDSHHAGLGDRFYATLDKYLPMEDIWNNLEWYKETYLEVRRTEGCINTARSKRTEEPQRYVVKVTIKSCQPTPVYDLSVSKYHNYAVDLGDESAIYVHNTFSLLYGAMEESFARNYCNGDHDYAKMVYGGFFEAYPRVKEWVEERHREVQKDHRVSLELSGRFIPISSEGDSKGALNSMLRKSQNYPIQAQSADLTGCVIFDLQKYIEENNMKSLVIMYVHDSIEVDVYPYELIQLVDKLKVLLNESPMRRMGLPSKADVTLGMSLGHEIEMEDITYNEDFTEGVLTLKGYKDEIYDTVNNWKKAYSLVEISDESWKESFVSMGDLFILKKAYTPTLGTMRYTGSCKVHIKYYD